MKRKRLLLVGLTSILSAGVLTFVGLSTQNGIVREGYATEHTASCFFNHYAYRAPSETEPGSKEYWICCTHNEPTLEKPTIGQHIDAEASEVSDAVISYLKQHTDDVRYIAPTKVSSLIAKIDALPALDKTDVFANMGYVSLLEEYNALTNEEKALITNSAKLLEFNDRFDVIDSTITFNSPISATIEQTDSYGKAMKLTNTATSGENFGFGNLKLNSFDAADYSSITFAIYADQPTDWHFTNWQKYINGSGEIIQLNKVKDEDGKESYEAPKSSTFNKGWTTMTVNAADFASAFTNALDIAPYYTPASCGYGLNEGNHAYITAIYGIKKSNADALISKIDALPTLNTTDVFANMGYVSLLEEYNALSTEEKALITNSAKLLEFNDRFDVIDSTISFTESISVANEQTDSYGKARKLVNTTTSGKNFEWGTLALSGFDAANYSKVEFALYVDQPTDIHFTDWKSYLLNDGTTTASPTKPNYTYNKGWTKLTVDAAEFSKFNTFGVYYTQDGAGYGLSSGNHHAYITAIYGIKTVSSEVNAVINMIDSLPSVHSLVKDSESQIIKCENAYMGLSVNAREAVTNYSSLELARKVYDDNYKSTLSSSDVYSY